MTLLTLSKVDLRAKNITRAQEDHSIMINLLINQEHSILNVYVPNNRISKFIKQNLQKNRQVPIIFEDFYFYYFLNIYILEA